jgi:acetate kinase
MEKNYLVIDLGSSSKRYAFFLHEQELFRAHFHKDQAAYKLLLTQNGHINEISCSNDDYNTSHRIILKHLRDEGLMPTAIGIRVVAPGTYFTEHQKITEVYLDELAGMRALVPLHSIATIDEIVAWQQTLPEVPLYAISDSAFHITQSAVNRHYTIPISDTIDYDIYRFGYHGISCASIVHKLRVQKQLPQNMIICHLGSGCSITAVKNGLSIHTSMGFTPLEGLCMSTRIGTIDAGALLYLQQKKNMTIDELYTYLNQRCGLAGLSDTDGDMRTVLEHARTGDTRAQRALDIFIKKIQETIAAYMISLQGLDLIVFTGGIGEKSPLIRERICDGLRPLEVAIDHKANNVLIDKNGYCESSDSKVKIAVMQTDELGQMARELSLLLKT